jgi:large subunit ribosomal protein L22
MYASLNNWRGSPRKFNEYLREVRGLVALKAADRLNFMPSPYAHALSKLILSAVSNAVNNASIDPNALQIKEATVGRASFLKRVCFRGRGRMGRVTKFGCNVKIVLGKIDDSKKADKKLSSNLAKTESKVESKADKKISSSKKEKSVNSNVKISSNKSSEKLKHSSLQANNVSHSNFALKEGRNNMNLKEKGVN